ncbi:MAG TPA: type II toxin-antitoxin system RelE/ParE family toxin [Methylobacterium sp.]|jgi:toxin ParE1/3/4|uniref:type II toxin-antitoxin system RelE/ParE family toxin n=1 Tax=Methylorubrum sp. B1-46 TaxID=2897334 RepID=UPI001E43D2EB|nr:type II toxin-antitoxin system RelE/ParE family toxin [Methylorubrum sp. B1-46]UGB25821.1 type II toxin-antitoxin system RelE/ParE family toxin [Methylorubrum sp. B1-46]HEV2541342.1 type II toxin-antitoxin system RelE/ParE family toxin [Methylobacterium sp.]
MACELTFHRLARADLFSIDAYIEEQSGPIRASGFLDRIESACRGLTEFPEKGTPRDDISVGLRTWAMERRVPIVYRATPEQIEVLRVLYAGRDFRADAVPH